MLGTDVSHQTRPREEQGSRGLGLARSHPSVAVKEVAFVRTWTIRPMILSSTRTRPLASMFWIRPTISENGPPRNCTSWLDRSSITLILPHRQSFDQAMGKRQRDITRHD